MERRTGGVTWSLISIPFGASNIAFVPPLPLPKQDQRRFLLLHLFPRKSQAELVYYLYYDAQQSQRIARGSAAAQQQQPGGAGAMGGARGPTVVATRLLAISYDKFTMMLETIRYASQPASLESPLHSHSLTR